MMELCGMWSPSSLPSPLYPGEIAPGRVQSMGIIELFEIYTEFKQMKVDLVLNNLQ